MAAKPKEKAVGEYLDPVVEVYKRDVDRTLLRENLRLTTQERSEKFERMMRLVMELRGKAQKANPES